MTDHQALLDEPIAIDCRMEPLSQLCQREWLVTNRLGSYASATVVGANTRRYHGLLVAATMPPVGRKVLLSHVLGQLVIGVNGNEKTWPLSSFRFAGAFSPPGHVHLSRFINDAAPTWEYEFGAASVICQLTLAERSNVLAMRYKVHSHEPARLRLWPFAALRDFHSVRRSYEDHNIIFAADNDGVRIEDRNRQGQSVWVACEGGEFVVKPQWWYRFQYSVDIERGQEGFEDLHTPGYFEVDAACDQWVQLTAAPEATGALDFDAVVEARRQRRAEYVAALGENTDETTRRLAVVCDDFLVSRDTPTGPSGTVVAGYPWFGDWGRDSFIALAGLAIVTGQLDRARQVLSTFAHAVADGMIPNRFDDYGGSPHYNSIDASLWFVLAVDRYLSAGGDGDSWAHEFFGPVSAILRAYHDGTTFEIHADADGLLTGGSIRTQLTWMDVKLADEAVTPRHGRAVEVNALWLEALHIMARRCRGIDDAAAEHYAAEAQRVAKSFREAFWYDAGGYLYDCIGPEGPDASLRPNQVIAVAMAHCPLSEVQQKTILRVVVDHLLTPYGLRTLAREDPRYRGRYAGSWESRDRAYHQGTVWPWLMGPLVQGFLKVYGLSADARRRADEWLRPLDGHLRTAGLGTISEIFDGDPPHTPRGCISQAWSVAEILRAKRMIQTGRMV